MARTSTLTSSTQSGDELENQDDMASDLDGSPTPPDTSSSGGRAKPVKITVNLIQRAWRALGQVCGLTGESKTDAINRSVLLYSFVQSMIHSGHVIKLVGPDGSEKEIHLF